jgi:hypothetical protein
MHRNDRRQAIERKRAPDPTPPAHVLAAFGGDTNLAKLWSGLDKGDLELDPKQAAPLPPAGEVPHG